MKKETRQAPNIRFVGKPHRVFGKRVEAEILTQISDGESVYRLPGTREEQTRGFYHERAAEIVRLYPSRYKLLKPKGKKR